MDTWQEQQRIASIVVAEADALGLQLIRLPSEKGTRFGLDVPADSVTLDELVRALGSHQLVLERRETLVKNNLYEFDQVTATAPPVSVYFRIRPEAHCSNGVTYVLQRTITLELTERRDEIVIVPRPALGPRVYGREEYDRIALTNDNRPAPVEFDWPFPIDLVYTWVDADDPVWQEQRAKLSPDEVPSETPAASVNAARWYSRDELKYSLRSAWMYASFVRKIFIVTNGQVPGWLFEHWPNVEVITHDALYDDMDDLPTFNSNHIETVLHRIPDLSEHFLYLNDDFFFASPAAPSDFFTESGTSRIFRSARFLDERPVTEYDRATVAAHKNTRDLLAAKLGVRPSQKFQHAPYVMRRSVWYEIEELFGDELRATRHNRFRSWSDLNGQFLYCHYALIKGYGVPSGISYKYLEVLDEDFEQRLAELDSPKYKVFCLNDANSTSENADANGTLIREFFNSRFPVSPPWEDGSTFYQAAGRFEEIAINDTRTLEREVRSMGPTVAKFRYRALLNLRPSAPLAKKLIQLAVNERDVQTALRATDVAAVRGDTIALLRLDILSKTGSTTEEVKDFVPTQREQDFVKGLRYLARTVETEDDLQHYLSVVLNAPAKWLEQPTALSRIAAAARRAGRPTLAREYLEKAVLSALNGPYRRSGPKKREAERLNDPWVVVDDLYEVASAVGATVFADAGTLLGFVREGDFLAHDYDIDFSCRSENEFTALYEAIQNDWRFDVSRVRTPDKILQARHVNGTLIDVFRHVPHDSGWVKASHVYGWQFDDFDLGEIEIAGRSVVIPVPAEKYLQQMYGADWRIPQPGFDSRLLAPNCFFPDREEVICTVLNKILGAVLNGDDDSVRSSVAFLRDELGYDVPSG